MTNKIDKLSKLFEQYKMSPNEAMQKSKAWYMQQVALLDGVNISPNALMRDRYAMNISTKIIPGSMYIFKYDPKYADTLPYYDRYPLVIPFRHVPNGFYGLNLHYLHPQLRVALLDALMVYATNKNLNENTKLKFTWQMAAIAAKNKHIGSCVKMYLGDHIESQFMRIVPEYWVSAIMLPLESFQNANKSQVWKESSRL